MNSFAALLLVFMAANACSPEQRKASAEARDKIESSIKKCGMELKDTRWRFDAESSQWEFAFEVSTADFLDSTKSSCLAEIIDKLERSDPEVVIAYTINGSK